MEIQGEQIVPKYGFRIVQIEPRKLKLILINLLAFALSAWAFASAKYHISVLLHFKALH